MRSRECPDCGLELTRKWMDLWQGSYREFFWFCEDCQKFYGNGYDRYTDQDEE